MSALLNQQTLEPIKINQQFAFKGREFHKTANVLETGDFDECLVLSFLSCTLLKLNNNTYRNHFTLFTSQNEIIICLAETTLWVKDDDVELRYMRIKPLSATKSSCCGWNVSQDKIEYSNKCPADFTTFTLLCHGEWWFFDRGYILNGKGATTSPLTYFIYMELTARSQPVQAANQLEIESPNTVVAQFAQDTQIKAVNNVPYNCNYYYT